MRYKETVPGIDTNTHCLALEIEVKRIRIIYYGMMSAPVSKNEKKRKRRKQGDLTEDETVKLERKRNREKLRRDEVNHALDELAEVIYMVEPNLKSGASKTDENGKGEALTSRAQLIHFTRKFVLKVHEENKRLKALVEESGAEQDPFPTAPSQQTAQANASATQEAPASERSITQHLHALSSPTMDIGATAAPNSSLGLGLGIPPFASTGLPPANVGNLMTPYPSQFARQLALSQSLQGLNSMFPGALGGAAFGLPGAALAGLLGSGSLGTPISIQTDETPKEQPDCVGSEERTCS